MIYDDIQRLISYALKNELIAPEDVYVIRNHFMEVFQLTDWQESEADCHDADIDTLLCPLVDYACSQNIISDTTASRDLFDTKLMGILTPMPREVTAEFRQYYAKSPESATSWYYDFSKKLNYVRQGRIA
ncbi:MAG: galactose-1-phosphate uridylyltransferase, partial [Porcipelethomonas sp.]